VWLDTFRSRTNWNAHANRRNYEAPADPWRLVRVDPAAVERFNVVSLLWGVGRVRGGEWDRPEHCRRIDETKLHEGLTQRFEEGHEWEETSYYERIAERFEESEDVRGYESLEAFISERPAEIEALYESMQDGYRPNRGTVYETPADVEYIHELEPLVLIGRSGEIIWSEGFHRLVLATIVGIDEIPVYVLRRHEEWQRTRDELATILPEERGPELRERADHPDVRDIVE
jgi:hypothetical protein